MTTKLNRKQNFKKFWKTTIWKKLTRILEKQQKLKKTFKIERLTNEYSKKLKKTFRIVGESTCNLEVNRCQFKEKEQKVF